MFVCSLITLVHGVLLQWGFYFTKIGVCGMFAENSPSVWAQNIPLRRHQVPGSYDSQHKMNMSDDKYLIQTKAEYLS